MDSPSLPTAQSATVSPLKEFTESKRFLESVQSNYSALKDKDDFLNHGMRLARV